MKPVSLPRHLLDRPDIQQALAQRNFTVVFTAAHKAGLSYNAIADTCDLDADRVSLVARGRQTIVRMTLVEQIADGLHIPGAMLGLAARHWELSQPAGAGGEDDPVQRRDFLLGTLTVGAALPLSAITEVRNDTEQALDYSGADDVTRIEAAAERYGAGYRDQTPAEMLDKLVAAVADGAPQLRLQHPRSVRIDLARAVSRLGGMAAIVLHDMGRHDEAMQWFSTAQKAARKAGDRSTLAWVLARKAMVPVNYGAPELAAKIAAQARRAAGRGETAAAALAASVAARAFALSHRNDQATIALRDAERIAGKLSSAESVDTWFGYCLQKHHVHRSQALTILGDTAAARASQAAGVELSSTTGMTRTLLLLDSATCLRHEGDTDGACTTAADVLTQAPERFRGGLVRQRAVDLYRSVPDASQTSPPARRLAELLRTTPV